MPNISSIRRTRRCRCSGSGFSAGTGKIFFSLLPNCPQSTDLCARRISGCSNRLAAAILLPSRGSSRSNVNFIKITADDQNRCLQLAGSGEIPWGKLRLQSARPKPFAFRLLKPVRACFVPAEIKEEPAREAAGESISGAACRARAMRKSRANGGLNRL